MSKFICLKSTNGEYINLNTNFIVSFKQITEHFPASLIANLKSGKISEGAYVTVSSNGYGIGYCVMESCDEITKKIERA